jgi:hypothetical protein
MAMRYTVSRSTRSWIACVMKPDGIPTLSSSAMTTITAAMAAPAVFKALISIFQIVWRGLLHDVIYSAACESGRLANVMQSEQFGQRTRRDCVGAALFVTKLYERNVFIQLLNNRTDLPSRKPLCRKVRQQRYDVKIAPIIAPRIWRILAGSRRFSRSRSIIPL